MPPRGAPQNTALVRRCFDANAMARYAVQQGFLSFLSDYFNGDAIESPVSFADIAGNVHEAAEAK